MNKQKVTKALMSAILLAAILAGCAGSSQEPGPTSLLLTHWEASDIGGQPVLRGDPPTLLLLAGPMIGLYFFAAGIGWAVGRGRRRAQA